MEYLENELFLLALTFGIFFVAVLLQKKTGLLILNPILLTIALLIVFLKFTGISYETYHKSGQIIEFWLKPAVVALGVPLYHQLEAIKKQLLPILVSDVSKVRSHKVFLWEPRPTPSVLQRQWNAVESMVPMQVSGLPSTVSSPPCSHQAYSGFSDLSEDIYSSVYSSISPG